MPVGWLNRAPVPWPPKRLSIPVVASGGAGLPDASLQGVEGCVVSSVASMLRYRGHTIGDIKRKIAASGLFIRMD